MRPVEQVDHALTIVIIYSSAFQAKPATRLKMPHESFGPDLSIANKKINKGLRADRSRIRSFDEQAFQTQIPNSRRFVTSSARPDDPDAIGCLYTGGHASGCLVGCICFTMRHCGSTFNPQPGPVVLLRPRVSPASAVRLQEQQTPRCHNACRRQCLEIARQQAYQYSSTRERAWQSRRATSVRSLNHKLYKALH